MMKNRRRYCVQAVCAAVCAAALLLGGCQPGSGTEKEASEESSRPTVSLTEEPSREESPAGISEESPAESEQEAPESSEPLPEDGYPQEKVVYLTLSVGEKRDLREMLQEVGEAAASLLRKLEETKAAFASRQESVAVVDEKGTVIANGVGTATVVVQETPSGDLLGVLKVEVTKKELHNNLITPKLWEASDAKGNVIYLFGTIHAGDSDVMHMPDYFEEVFDSCEALAVECDVTSPEGIAAVTLGTQKLAYQDGTTIQQHVPEKDYEAARQILQEESTYVSLYDGYQPIMWVSLLENVSMKKAGLSSVYGVDTILLAKAKLQKKEVLELESVSFQMDMMAGFSEEVQQALLHSHVQEGAAEEMANALKDLYIGWKNGTLDEKTVGISDEENSSDDKKEEALLKEYNDIMITQRNKGMAEKGMEYLQSGKKVLLTAGSAHFYGEGGIIALLKQQGCTIREISEASPLSASSGGAAPRVWGSAPRPPFRGLQSTGTLKVLQTSVTLDPGLSAVFFC